MPLRLPVGNAKRGADIYTRCQACHALDYNRTGPKHCGVVGRKSASVPGFDYSPAMKRANLTWDEQTLDRFLANPPKMVPGTTMTYAGVPDPQERADLIAYLREAGHVGGVPVSRHAPPSSPGRILPRSAQVDRRGQDIGR